MDASTPIGKEEVNPQPGDLSICSNCGEIGIFEDNFTVRHPTDEEFAQLKASPIWDLVRTVSAAAAYLSRKRTRNN